MIGGGWFGCHIAAMVKERGARVVLFEKHARLLSGTSLYNTGRLHMGFHYPRSLETRIQSLNGYRQFISQYSEICEKTGKNLYAIVSRKSILDYGTYLQIMDAGGIPYKKEETPSFLRGIEGVISCEELAINPHKARKHFAGLLESDIRYKTEVSEFIQQENQILIGDETFDYIINCSYFELMPKFCEQELVHEVVVTLLLDQISKEGAEALVVMDGDFFSLNPYFTAEGTSCHSLYHVRHSVVFRSQDRMEAADMFKRIQSKHPLERLYLAQFLEDVRAIYPDFSNHYEVSDSFVSLRTKLDNKHAGRESLIINEGNVIHVLAGKISSVFTAGEECIRILLTSLKSQIPDR